MLTRTAILTAALGLCVPGLVHAGEILVRPDRTHLAQGESALITITVRGSAVRPTVTPPTLPYCQIEQVQDMQQRSRAPERGLVKSAPSASGGMARAFDDLNRQVQDLPGQLSQQGLGDAGLLKEYEGMLQGIRRQAQEALQNGNGPKEYAAVYRVTPQRSGELTLTPFILKIGGSSFLTKPLSFTIEPAAAKVDTSTVTTAVPEQPGDSTRKPPAVGLRGLALKPWHGLIALLAAPVLGAAIALCARRREPRRRGRGSPRGSAAQPLAGQQALSRLAEASDLPAVAEALSEYVRRRCQLPAGEITPAEAAESLRTAGVSGMLADSVATLLDTCATSQFAAGSIAVDSREVVGDARRVVLEIER